MQIAMTNVLFGSAPFASVRAGVVRLLAIVGVAALAGLNGYGRLPDRQLRETLR